MTIVAVTSTKSRSARRDYSLINTTTPRLLNSGGLLQTRARHVTASVRERLKDKVGEHGARQLKLRFDVSRRLSRTKSARLRPAEAGFQFRRGPDAARREDNPLQDCRRRSDYRLSPSPKMLRAVPAPRASADRRRGFCCCRGQSGRARFSTPPPRKPIRAMDDVAEKAGPGQLDEVKR